MTPCPVNELAHDFRNDALDARGHPHGARVVLVSEPHIMERLVEVVERHDLPKQIVVSYHVLSFTPCRMT